MAWHERTRRRWMQVAWTIACISGAMWAGLTCGRPLCYTDGEQEFGGLHADRVPANDLWGDSMVHWPAPLAELEIPARVEGRFARLPDGRLLFGARGNDGSTDLWTWDPTADVPPEPAYGLNSSDHEIAPAIDDQGVVWFASDRSGGAGGFDLWVSRCVGLGFARPQPVVAVNTLRDEVDPAPAPDGRRVVFARVDRMVGEGRNGELWHWREDSGLDPTPLFDRPTRGLRRIDREPAFHADGAALWFLRQSDGTTELCRSSRLGERFAEPQVASATWSSPNLHAPLSIGPRRLWMLGPTGGPSSGDRSSTLVYATAAIEVHPWWPGQRWLEWLLASVFAFALLLLLLLHFGRRWATLDLVAQCLLLSLLLHVLLFLWLMGVEVVGALDEDGDAGATMEVSILSAKVVHATGDGDGSGLAAEVRFEPTPRRVQVAAPASELGREPPALVAAAAASPPNEVARPTLAAVPEAVLTDTVSPSRLVREASSPPVPDVPQATAAPEAPAEPVAATNTAGLFAPKSLRASVAGIEGSVLVAAPTTDVAAANGGATVVPAAAPNPIDVQAAASEFPMAAVVLHDAARPDVPESAPSSAEVAEAQVAPRLPAMSLPRSLPLPSAAGAEAPPVEIEPRRVVGPTPAALASPAPASVLTAAAAPPIAAPVAMPPGHRQPTRGAAPPSVALREPARAAAPPPSDPTRSSVAAATARSPSRPSLRASRALPLPTEPMSATPAPQWPQRPATAVLEAAIPASEVAHHRDQRLPATTARARRESDSPGPMPPIGQNLREAPPVTAPPRHADQKAERPRPIPQPGVASASMPSQPRPLARFGAPARALAAFAVALPAVTPPATAVTRGPGARTAPVASPGREVERNAYSNRFGPAKAVALEQFGGTADTERAVARGLRYLASVQHRDGSWGDRGDFDGKYGFVYVGKTALCLLAFLGAGHTPASATEHSTVSARALDLLLGLQDPDTGAFGASSCYGHGIATYALAECYGLTRDARLLQPLERALDWILEHQGPRRDARNRGGWGYFSPQLDAEDNYARVSVTSWMVMALESARLSGVALPEQVLPAARRYLELSYDQPNGWFRYNHKPSRLRSGWPTLPASTPAAAFCLQLLGADQDDPMVRRALDYTVERRPRSYARYGDEQFVLEGQGNVYFWYYASLCCFLAGGEHWQQWNERLRELLPAAQLDDGSFPPIDVYAEQAGDRAGDHSYTTAMCVLSLEVYYRYFTPLLLGR